jgi:hypothetical protein
MTRWLIISLFLAVALILASPGGAPWLWAAALVPALLCLANVRAMAKRPTARLAAVLCWSGMATFVVVLLSPYPPPLPEPTMSADHVGTYLQPPPRRRVEKDFAPIAALYILSAGLLVVSELQGIEASRASRSANPA